MYKVMLIDDEPWIVEGLRKAADWEMFGFTVVGDALDAVEGIEKIEKLKPQVVFVDIRMPEITGLEMIRKVKGMGLDIQFVIVTGFAEFSFAREGISLGVFEYLLKPVEKIKLIEILEKLKTFLDSNSKINLYRNMEVIDELTAEDGRVQDNIDLLKQLGLENVYPCTRVAVVNCEHGSAFKSVMNDHDLGIVSLPVSSEKHFSLLNYNCTSDEKLVKAVHTMYKGLNYAGMSSESRNMGNLAQTVEEAEIAFHHIFIYEKNDIYFYKKPKYYSVVSMIDELTDSMRNLDFNSVYKYVDSLRDRLIASGNGIEELCFIFNRLISDIIGMKTDEKDEVPGFLTYENIIGEFNNYPNFILQFKKTLSGIEKDLISKNTPKHNDTIKGIIEHINMNYSEELHLNDISSKFHINPNYLSIVFKKTTGKTFSQYLTDIRMKKACDLLLSTSLTIEGICWRVGYTDYYSFNKAFKKCIGITPAKFKRAI